MPSILRIACFLFCLACIGHLPAQTYTPGQTYYGANSYIEYIAGDLPIIISAPHGGYLTPATIPDRTFGTTGRDGLTEEMAYELDSAVQVLFGGHAHIIINKLARIKLDANREIVEAAQGDPNAENAWHEFHDFIQHSKDSAVAQYGTALYIDLHAHGHSIQRIELGYLISKTEMQNSDAVLDAQNFQDSCSIKHLKNVQNPGSVFSELFRGSDCLGEYMVEYGYPSVPSASDPAPAPADAYFSGGYNTARHGSRDSSVINGVQFELNYTGIRDTRNNRKAYASRMACAMRNYMDFWFFNLDAWDPGHVVTSTADHGPGSLRSALLGAEDGDEITFSSALLGDTIRLESELRICADVTLQGPGASQLAISGGDSVRLVHVLTGHSVAIRDLSLVRGHTPDGEDGGAILADGDVRLAHCTLAFNYSQDDGGAISVTEPNTVWLDTCLVEHNSCEDDGGALRCPSGNMVITASTIRDNYATSQGGGLSVAGMVTITASTFSGNEAGSSGGAIRSFGGLVTLENSTLEGNIAGNRGGGISTTATVELYFCTIVNNTAVSLGGGLRNIGGVCQLENTLVALNTGSADPNVSTNIGAFVSYGHNLIGDTTGGHWVHDTGDQLGSTASPIDPMVLSLTNNGGLTETVALQIGSPAIDAGNAASAPTEDQRGWMRVFGNRPDIGAFEVQPATGREALGETTVFHLYPNPTQGVLHLEFPEVGEYQIQVSNHVGQIVLTQHWSLTQSQQLFVGHLPNGMYQIQVEGSVTGQSKFVLIQ